MWKGINELVSILLLWGFWYLGSFMLMVVAIVYVIQSNKPPIIQEQHYHTTKQVFQPPKRVLVEREVCKDIRGCKIVKGKCIDCVMDFVWE